MAFGHGDLRVRQRIGTEQGGHAPQVGDAMPEILTPEERREAVAQLLELRKQYPKLDMAAGLVRLGSATEFAAAADGPSRRPWSRFLAWASLAAAAAIAAVPVLAWVRRRA